MKPLNKKKISLVILLLLLFGAVVPLFVDKKSVHKLILSQVNTLTDYKLHFEDTDVSFFPRPTLIVHTIKLHEPSGKGVLDIDLKDIECYLSWKLLIGKVVITGIHFNEGKLILTIPEKKIQPKEKEDSEFNMPNLSSFLSIHKIGIDNLSVLIDNKQDKRKDEFFIQNLWVFYSRANEITINSDFIYDKSPVKTSTTVIFNREERSFKNVGINSDITLDNFPIRIFKPYYSFFKQENFYNTQLSGNYTIIKNSGSEELLIRGNNAKLAGLAFKKGPRYPAIFLNFELSYPYTKNQFNLNYVRVRAENLGEGYVTGNINFDNHIRLYLNIDAEYGDLYGIIYMVVLFVDTPTFNPYLNFYSTMNIHGKRVYFDHYNFYEVNADLDIFNTAVKININNGSFLGGNIKGKGIIQANQAVTYEFDLQMQDIIVQDLIAKYSDKKFITGRLSSTNHFISSGNDFDQFINNFHAEGKAEVKKGELLGYANFIKPLFSLGKLVNVLGPKGKNTEFQTITTGFKVKDKLITIPDLKMIGVGIDAKGAGHINFDRKIDMMIYAGLGGIAGKALYVPIIYKGTIPNNDSYIDPIWLGSVYVGATFIAGPVGATVGGVAGSAVSEYLHKMINGITSIFKKKPEE